MLVDGLPDLRANHASGVQRESQLDADRALILIDGGIAVWRAVGVDAGAVGVDFVAACHEVKRRKMSAARSTHVFSGNVRSQAAGDQRQILLQGPFPPSVFADRGGIGQFEWLDVTWQAVGEIKGRLA